MTPEVVILRCGSDNYSYLILSGDEAVAVDTSDAATVNNALKIRGLKLSMILSTHHHADHTGGNEKLHRQTGCTVAGADRRITACTAILADNENITVNGHAIVCMHLPGHTNGSCAFYLPGTQSLFTGDTLFYAGCGRLFECTASTMHHSIRRIMTLPAETHIYAGHEYTLDNLDFARSVEPSNNDVVQRKRLVEKTLRQQGMYGPSTLETELATNPFMRTGSHAIRSTLHMSECSDEAVLAELRERKNRF